MNRVTILLFATLRDLVGEKTFEIELPAATTVADLKARLVKAYPKLSQAQGSMMVAVNREYAGDEQVIPAEAEVAFFPPVSGG
jgi:molybdopterin converting factor subunit 1